MFPYHPDLDHEAPLSGRPDYVNVTPCSGLRRCGVFRCWEQIGSKLLPGYTNGPSPSAQELGRIAAPPGDQGQTGVMVLPSGCTPRYGAEPSCQRILFSRNPFDALGVS